MRSARLLPASAAVAIVMVVSCTESQNPMGPRGTNPSTTPAPAFDRVQATNSYGNGAVTLGITADDTVGCGDTTTTVVTLTGSTQPQAVDLAVALDASGSIGYTNWAKVQQFGMDLANSIPWSPTGNRMGVVEFSTYATVPWRFLYQQNGTVLANMFANLPWIRGYTNTKAAVDSVIKLYDTEGRTNAARMMLLVTDGVPLLPANLGDPDPCPDAASLAAHNIHTVVIGVGNFDPQPIQCLVTDPSDLIQVSDFSGLSSILNPILQQVPRVSQATYTATVPAGFALVGTPSATRGTVTVSGSQVTWTVDNVGAETDSLAMPMTHTGTSGGQQAMLTGQSLDYNIGTDTHTEAVDDVMTEVIGCDTTPPVITPDITGTLGDNNWYTSDVTLAWNVTDPESAVTSETGCDTTVVAADTTGADFACSATSSGGTDTVSVTIKRDATPPTVTYSGNQGTYSVLDTIDITCTADDATSGVASTTCADITGTGLDLGLGTHADTATATDNAGNVGTGTTTFSVEASLDDLEALVRQWVDQHGVQNSLIAKLEAAKNAANSHAYDGALQAFVNELEAQSGKDLTKDKADTLMKLTKYLDANVRLKNDA